jgi:cobyrinic acid a,c-diamide synthase
MSARALVISAIASGRGKATVTAMLVRQLSRAETRAPVFKTSADFFDPLVLERAVHTRRSPRPDGTMMHARVNLHTRAESL